MTASLCAVLAVWAVVVLRHRRPRARRHPAVVVPRAPTHRRGREVLARWRTRQTSALPEAIDTVAACLRSGRSLADGLAVAAAQAPPPLAAELASVVGSIGRGMATRTAVGQWAVTSVEPGAALVAAAVGLADDAGADTAGALTGVADTLRERRALGRELRALSAQARLSAVVVAVAPIGFAVVAALADPATGRFLLASRGGLACLAVGATLDLAGWRWMGRITAAVQ
jgi:tight adherence protein B